MAKYYIFNHEYVADLESPDYKLGTLFARNYDKKRVINRTKIVFEGDKIYINNEFAGRMKDIDHTPFGFLANNDKVIACYELDNSTHTNGGGRFVIYDGGFAEYTIFGSGRPIIDSFFGKLSRDRSRVSTN